MDEADRDSGMDICHGFDRPVLSNLPILEGIPHYMSLSWGRILPLTTY